MPELKTNYPLCRGSPALQPIARAMCGIFLSVSKHDYVLVGKELRTRLTSRGPDSCKSIKESFSIHGAQTVFETGSACYYVTIHATVLSLRSEHVVSQPVQTGKSSMNPAEGVNHLWSSSSQPSLCWNGEAWRIGAEPVRGNDAERIFERLQQASLRDAKAKTSISPDTAVLKAMTSINGPFAFVFLDAYNSRIYFGRDVLGRRSLLYKTEDGNMLLSSVSDCSEGWSEVDADGVYVLNLCAPISFEDNTKPLLVSALSSTAFDIAYFPYSNFGKTFALNRNALGSEDGACRVSSAAVMHLEEHLRSSLSLRLHTLTPHSEDDKERRRSPRVAVLFSGGIDCTVLASLVHDYLPQDEPIDLLNVAFENPRIHSGKTSAFETKDGASALPLAYEVCPDRITARTSHAELQDKYPDREWNLVRINVSYSESLQHRETVKSLIHPHNTEMDMSIALALYFAARGTGVSHALVSPYPINYKTPARVLISGLGADELFAGYQRHAVAFAHRGQHGLLDELALDINRLGKRNLGRDDRVISHWGKEVRYPYLDEDLVRWALQLPVEDKSGFGFSGTGNMQAEGLEPGKLILRLLATRIEMEGVAKEKKRAIQFGARTAKMESGRSKGTDSMS